MIITTETSLRWAMLNCRVKEDYLVLYEALCDLYEGKIVGYIQDTSNPAVITRVRLRAKDVKQGQNH